MRKCYPVPADRLPFRFTCFSFVPSKTATLKLRLPFGLAITALILMHPSAAQSASFDCKRATGAVEKTICSNSNLSTLDEELAKVYLQALLLAPDREGLKREQRDWVKKQRNKCTNADCLSSSYQARISAVRRGLSSIDSSSAAKISGVWRNMKPDAGGPSRLIIKEKTMSSTQCKKRIFVLKEFHDEKYVFIARDRGKCSWLPDRYELNKITITITDEETIHTEFYSGADDNDWLGSDNFFKIE